MQINTKSINANQHEKRGLGDDHMGDEDRSVPAVNNGESDEIEFLEKNQDFYPFPQRCNYTRFILPVSLFKTLREHPLSRDLYVVSAGHFKKEQYRIECNPLPYGVINYCTGGKMVLQANNRSYPAALGDLTVIPPGVSYAIEMSQNAPYSIIFAAFAGELLAEYMKFLNLSQFVTHVGLDPDMVTELERICDLRTSDFLLDTFVSGSHRLKFLLTRFSLAISRGEQLGRSRLDIDSIRRLMASHIDGSLTVRDLARSVNISPRHFARLFKEQSGMPPMRYYLQTRFQHACHQLDTTRYSIGQIAAAVGFDDPHYFSRIFRKVVGQTPNAYRQGITKEWP